MKMSFSAIPLKSDFGLFMHVLFSKCLLLSEGAILEMCLQKWCLLSCFCQKRHWL